MKGDKVHLLAPSMRPVSRLEVDRAKGMLEAIGFSVQVGKNVFNSHGYLAGSDSQRACDLNDAFKDLDCKAIFFLRGGYGALRILPLLNYQDLLSHPKLIMGSNDVTSILLAINKFTGVPVVYGPNLDELKHAPVLEYIDTRLKQSSPTPILHSNFQSAFAFANPGNQIFAKAFWSVEKDLEGELTGGNLTSIASTLGTKYEVSFKDKIVFLNDCNERNDILLRWLVQLSLSSKLKEAKAILFGQFHDCDSRGSYSMHSIQDMIIDYMDNLGVPYVLGLPMNEGGLPNFLPIGVRAKLHAQDKFLEFKESIFE